MSKDSAASGSGGRRDGVGGRVADERVEGLEAGSYDGMYRSWEGSNWSAAAISFAGDRLQWQGLDELQRDALLWACAPLFVAEESVTRMLTPALDAASGPRRLLFATQVVDDARHSFFLERFFLEAAGQGWDSSSALAAAHERLTWGFGQVLEDLERVTDALRKKPKDRALLAQAVAACHVVLKGVLMTSVHSLVAGYLERAGVLPGFVAGLQRVATDESRHVSFGTKLLRELMRESKDCRGVVIETLDRVLLAVMAAFVPPERDLSYPQSLGFTITETYALALRLLDDALRRLSVDASEVRLFAYQNPSASYEERARQVWVLIDAGVVGDDGLRPELTPQAFEILFEGMTRIIGIDALRSLGGPIEWDFTDAEAWHMVATDEHAEAKPGRAGDPALRLEISSEDFARLAMGHTDPRWALLKRRLKVHGHLSAKAKLPKLFR